MIKPVYYMQSDPRWGQADYSAAGEIKTISAAGCGPSSAAMVLQTLRPDKTITPLTTAKWSLKHGYKIRNQGTAYSYFKSQFNAYGIECEQLNYNSLYHNPKASTHDTAKNLLKKGFFIIAVMGPGTWTRGGHYVVAWKIDENDNVYINDPASRADNRIKNKWNVFKNEVKYYWKVSYGKTTVTRLKGCIYSKPDALSDKLGKIKNKSQVYHIKDTGNGWSIAANNNKVGFVKNTVLADGKLSHYPTYKLKENAKLKTKNNKMSKTVGILEHGNAVRIISKRKFWTNCITDLGKGYIATKKIAW